MRLTDNLDYFEDYRKQLLLSAQIKIAYYWRKKLKRRRKRKEFKESKQVSGRYGGSRVKPYIDGKIKPGAIGN